MDSRFNWTDSPAATKMTDPRLRESVSEMELDVAVALPLMKRTILPLSYAPRVWFLVSASIWKKENYFQKLMRMLSAKFKALKETKV